MPAGVVRCYCNLPACITTGYMCKSAGRGCFSDLVDHVDVYRARHGCLDLLDSDRQRQCKNQPRPSAAEEADDDDDVPAWEQDGLQAGQQDGPRQGDVRIERREEDTLVVDDLQQDAAPPRDTPSLLLCCTEDMCNHIDSPDSRMRHSGPNGSDASHVTISSPVGAGAGAPLGQVAPPAGAGVGSAEAAAAARSTEMWFKAATIAVPICGALILVLLIVLAVRLLRADSQHQRASKLRLGPQPHCPGAGAGGAAAPKLNYSANYDLLDLSKDDSCNQQRDVLLAPEAGAGAPKSSYREVLASFVPWTGSLSAPVDVDPPINV
ncbi:BMP and activin membrane-bound inhibitor-like protein [Frankliniella fusca]|uniref:BMP and activin membrane-bound inhibitor-like protein n=1 Tax=Frankliniella fusca TaxID=407009 RepID=A0AAE1L719_9NEOP|nr:BMP and activin membrane-bound inhibitor-like protein [Frankliniella fusca]